MKNQKSLMDNEIQIMGRDLINLASLKLAQLSRTKDKLQESIESINKSGIIELTLKIVAQQHIENQIAKIEESMNFCEVLKKYINDNSEVTLSIRDLNFLENIKIYSINE